MRPVFKIRVEPDAFTEAASKSFDYKFTGESEFTGWEKPDLPNDFKLGLIVGPSGSGKTLLLNQFGKEATPVWNPDKAIISHFSTPTEAIDKLTAVGLNSIPAWCKPYHVLSTGEKFRADLARKLHTNAVIDEFTSVVDRNVAKAASMSLRRYVNRVGLKGIVLASCHRDIIEWLEPDWVFDTTNGEVVTSGFFRPKINIKIYPAKRHIWPLFAPHHYLSGDISPMARCFLATWDTGTEEVIVGFVASMTMPNAYMKNAWRGHRTVVLPEYQGMSIGPRISDAVAQIHINEGKRYFSRTAHPRFGSYRDASPLWKKTSKYGKLRTDVTKHRARGKMPWKEWNVDDVRIAYSHEYIGKPELKAEQKQFC